MKYLSLAILYFGTLTSGHAQDIITSDWFYSIGDTTKLAYFHPNPFVAPEEGADLTWDLSNAPSPKDETIFTWVDPSELDHSSEFPDATIACKTVFGGELYFKEEGGQLLGVGFSNSNFKRVYEGGHPIEAADDFSFGDVKTASYKNIKTNYQDGFMTISDEMFELSFVGWGKVITPIGTYENCVMTKFVRTNPGLSDFIEYRFYKDNLANRIASYLVYTSGNVEPASWVFYKINQLTTSTKELENTTFDFSGPFNNTIFIASEKEMEVHAKIMDISGRIILDQAKSIYSGSNQLEIPSSMTDGIYVLLLTDTKSGDFKSYKFRKVN